MASDCHGTWSGDGSGVWGGSFDDSNLMLLNREINERASAIQQVVINPQIGLQAQFNLLSNNFSPDLSTTKVAAQSLVEWKDIEFKTFSDTISLGVSTLETDVIYIKRMVEALDGKFEALNSNVSNSRNMLINKVDTRADEIRDKVDDVLGGFTDLLRGMLRGVQALLQPFYQLCKRGVGPLGYLFMKWEDSHLHVDHHAEAAPHNEVWEEAGGVMVTCYPIAEYGEFKPEHGQMVEGKELYYSSELRDVLTFPYRSNNADGPYKPK